MNVTRLDPNQSVIIIVDKQRWYLDPEVCPFIYPSSPPPWLEKILTTIDAEIEQARSLGIPVLWTRMTEGAPDSPPNVLARWVAEPTEPRLLQEDPGHAFMGQTPSAGELVVDKVYPDSFTSPRLRQYFVDNPGRTTVGLLGAYAARCVLATAFGAQSAGLNVHLIDGAVAPHPKHPEELTTTLTVAKAVIE